MTTSTAAFETIREIILKNLYLPRSQSSRHIEYITDVDEAGNIVRDTFRINNWNALAPNLAQGLKGALSATINLYRTTTSLMINGKHATELATTINAMLDAIESHPETEAANKTLKTVLTKKQQLQQQQKEKASVNETLRRKAITQELPRPPQCEIHIPELVEMEHETDEAVLCVTSAQNGTTIIARTLMLSQ